jgi:hypothetical protein
MKNNFKIKLSDLNENQIKKILNHGSKDRNRWVITITDEYLLGWKWMSTFDIEKYLKEIGVLDSIIEWE